MRSRCVFRDALVSVAATGRQASILESIVSARRLLWMFVLLVGAGAVAGLLALRSSSQASPSSSAPAATWAAGARPAPAFSLRDQNGRAVSLAAYRGKPLLVTFID